MTKKSTILSPHLSVRTQQIKMEKHLSVHVTEEELISLSGILTLEKNQVFIKPLI